MGEAGFKLKRLTPIPLIGNLYRLIREVILSKRKKVGPLENFELFYEEILKTKQINTRVRRARQTSSVSA